MPFFMFSAGQLSIRSEEDGSLYMQSLVEVFRKQHKFDDVLTMMGKVNDMVWEKGKKTGNKQCPAPITTLTKKIYF